jgi:hypothetical protein
MKGKEGEERRKGKGRKEGKKGRKEGKGGREGEGKKGGREGRKEGKEKERKKEGRKEGRKRFLLNTSASMDNKVENSIVYNSKNCQQNWVPMANACNPSYLGG